MPARTLHEDIPDSMPANDFNLQEHLDKLAASQSTVDAFEL